MNSVLQQSALAAFAPLTGYAGFTVSGADASTFLHNQLTNEVNQLAWPAAQRTGYCTPKGRLLAVMLQWKDQDGHLHHLLPSELLAPICQRLKMFVLRSKVSFSPPEQAPMVFGLWGQGLNIFPVNTVHKVAEGDLMRAEDCPVLGPRAWLVVQHEQADQILQTLNDRHDLRQMPETAWQFSEIQCGLPWVFEKTKEAFVPQMINLELINGVSFTKGCYPGQEVVARSQYLGKLKRRMYRADIRLAQHDQTVVDPFTMIGMDIWSAADSSQPCGQVVSASSCFDASFQAAAGVSLLIECTQDAWSSADLYLGTPDGQALTPRDLPYPFPAAA